MVVEQPMIPTRTSRLQSTVRAAPSPAGLITAELAAEQPQRAHRLAFVAPAGILCGSSMLSCGMRLLGTLYDVRGRSPTLVGDAFGPPSLLCGAPFASEQDLSLGLASVHATTLLVWGEHDRLFPARIAAA